MNRTESFCKGCGNCCYYEIPVTILDIHRIAQDTGYNDLHAFENIIKRTISESSGLFSIAKIENGACVFLSDDKKCTIHKSKPRACEFYICQDEFPKKEIPWTSTCTDLNEQAKLWEQSVASMITKAYIKKNGAKWNEADYFKSLLSIYDNIVVSNTQKIKLAKDGNEQPVGLVYDCTKCKARGVCAKETLVTLDDIQRLAAYFKSSVYEVMEKYIEKQPSKQAGTFKLKRIDSHCIFFEQESHCSVKDARPMHCRFTPCPKKTEGSELYECLYLGAGSVEEQFRHQAAMAVTREYVSTYKTKYKKNAVESALKRFQQLVSNHIGLDEFCTKIASYRYVDDTILLKNKLKQS